MSVMAGVEATVRAGGRANKYVSSTDDDWYTPAWVFERLGLTFDLDPCSPAGGLSWLPARQHYALPGDGLALPWRGRVWLNPPYGGRTAAWVGKMATHRNGIALVNALTEARWFHQAVAGCDLAAFYTGRIYFARPDGTLSRGRPSMFLAWGEECAEALRVANLGVCVRAALSGVTE